MDINYFLSTNLSMFIKITFITVTKYLLLNFEI